MYGIIVCAENMIEKSVLFKLNVLNVKTKKRTHISIAINIIAYKLIEIYKNMGIMNISICCASFTKEETFFS